MSTTIAPQRRPPFWRNGTVLKWAAQLGVLLGLGAVFFLLVSQAAANLSNQGRTFDFEFLTDPTGIQVGEGIFLKPATGWQAFETGMVNMLRVTFSGIIAATILGVIVGVARLSHNWLVNRIATFYVEVIRNIPLLVQIVFWFFLGTLNFPELTAAHAGTRWLVFSRVGISIPWLYPTEMFWQWVVVLAIGFLAARFVYRKRVALREQTGRDTLAGRYGGLVFLGVAVVGWFAHPLTGVLEYLWKAVVWVLGAIPLLVWQLLLAALAVWLAVRWIRRFLDSLRSPAGLAKLTDDDWFRMVLAGVIGVVAALVLVFQPAITSAIRQGLEFLFGFFDQKFEFLRTGAPLRAARPEVIVPGRFPQIGPSGMTMTPAFFGVWIGVTLYTAAFIGEIVRGGILAVPKGQTEAGMALGLTRSRMMRLVVLPQAFRIVMPPIGNQYLNLAKNTSLGVAIGYAEVVAVMSTIANQTGDWLQVAALWMAFYLTVSLLLSAVVNYYNRKLKLVER